MNLEIEATFVEINKAELRQKLQSLGGKLLQPEMLMRRVIFDLPGTNRFARVRDEGNKIVMTYKCHHDNSLLGTEEINVEVNDYDSAIAFLKAVGLKAKAIQETYREEWELDGVEIDIDTWPWIPTYVEIEGPSAEAVTSVSQKLGFDMNDAHYGSVDEIYKLYYDVTNNDINYCPEIKFTDTPDWLAAKRRETPLT